MTKKDLLKRELVLFILLFAVTVLADYAITKTWMIRQCLGLSLTWVVAYSFGYSDCKDDLNK